jgi:hypothetical protein
MKNIEIIKKLLPLEQHKNLDKSGIYKITNIINNKVLKSSGWLKQEEKTKIHNFS